MRLPKRFALSTLLLLMLVVASVFGYAQWRRQWLIAEVASLNDPLLGIHLDGQPLVHITDSWFWPTVNDRSTIFIVRSEHKGFYNVHGKPLSNTQAKAYFETLAHRLHRIGVNDISFGLLTRRARPGFPTFVFKVTFTNDLNALENQE